MRKNVKASNWINLLLGAWVFISPWILVSSAAVIEGSAAVWNLWIVGLAISLISGLALGWLRAWEEWTNVALGTWLFFSAWMFAMPNSAIFWNSIIAGLIVAGLALMALPRAERYHQRAIR